MKDVCRNLGVYGENVLSYVTVHIFRVMVASKLYAASLDDMSVALRTGHRDLRSLNAYHNLRGTMGRRQQAAVLRQPTDTYPPTPSKDFDAASPKSGKKSKTMRRQSVDEENLEKNGCEERSAKRTKLREAFNSFENVSGNIVLNMNIYHAKDDRSEE